MNHVTSKLAAYLAGELSAQERDSIDRHLRACAACRREFAAQSETWALLEAVAEPGQPGRSVWPAVRARTIGASGARGRPALGWAAAALVAGMILGVSWPGAGPGPAETTTVDQAAGEDSWLQSSWLERDTGDDLASGWLLAGRTDDGGGS